jgi:hypothetical protein
MSAAISSRCSAVSRAASGSPRAWHGTHDLSSAFLTPGGYVINLAAWNEDAHFFMSVRHLAHLGAWASRRDLGFCSGVTYAP